MSYPWLRRVVLYVVDVDSRFFPHFSLYRIFKRFAWLNEARQRGIKSPDKLFLKREFLKKTGIAYRLRHLLLCLKVFCHRFHRR